MANERNIIVIGNKQLIHGFDLWGTLVDQVVFGPRVIEAYQALMDRRAGNIEGVVSMGTDEEKARIAQNIENYQGVLDGKDWATGARKKEFVDNVEEILWQSYARGEAEVDFTGALYDDTLGAMDNIASAGQGLCIITTGNSFWIKKALSDDAPDIAKVMGEVYFGNKTLAKTFEAAAQDLEHKGGQLVTHTEDQLKGFSGLLKSELVKRMNTVYVERANLATPEEVRAAGITAYTTDLRKVPYTGSG